MAQPAIRYVASPERDWPQFRGPHRNGISAETGLLSQWPEGGPAVIWTSTNLGSGYSAPIIVDGTIYLAGDVRSELHLFALDLQGALKWTATNGASWKNPFPGARASCTYSGGRILHMNGHGRLACFAAADGRQIWSVDVIEEFQSRVPTWGVSECVLVDRDRVIVTPGGRKASMAALDRSTGKTVWMAESLPPGKSVEGPERQMEGPAYSPPILIEYNGKRHIVAATARHILAVNADDGSLLWTFDIPTRYEVIGSSAVLCGDGVFVTAPDAEGGKFLRFREQSGKLGVEPAWTTSLDTCHGGIIALDGFLFGSWYRSYNGWGCVNATDGSVLYREKELVMGSVLFADGHLYCLSQAGAMALVKPDPTRWQIVSRFQFVEERKNDVWTHPVILNGRLYLRHQDKLVCFDIRSKDSPRRRN